MAQDVLVCVDGSDRSLEAARAGLAVVAADATAVLVTAIDPPDPLTVTGTGFAGGVMSEAEFEAEEAERLAAAEDLLGAAAESLGRSGAPTRVLFGPAGPAICDHAEAVGALAIVIGSRGHGGIARAVLGSVSDHVVRHAPCPVVVTGPTG